MIMKTVVILFLMLPFSAQGQMSKQDSIWLPLTSLIGSWQGNGGGQPGIGKYTRSYGFILNKKFIEVRTKSVYPPTDKYPNGEVHEDVGYISYDKRLKKFIFRQFHIEGFVNQYALDSLSADGTTVVFNSTAIENIPAGWRAKETCNLTSSHEFTETFELSGPNEPYEVYTKVKFQREK